MGKVPGVVLRRIDVRKLLLSIHITEDAACFVRQLRNANVEPGSQGDDTDRTGGKLCAQIHRIFECRALVLLVGDAFCVCFYEGSVVIGLGCIASELDLKIRGRAQERALTTLTASEKRLNRCSVVGLLSRTSFTKSRATERVAVLAELRDLLLESLCMTRVPCWSS